MKLFSIAVAGLLLSGCVLPLSPELEVRHGVGLSARDLLSKKPYKKLLIEFDMAPGAEIESESLDALKRFLELRTYKESIEFRIQSIPTPAYQGLDASRLLQAELKNRDFYPGQNDPSLMSVYVLVLGKDADAYLASGVTSIAAAYANTSIVVFSNRVRNQVLGRVQRDLVTFESAILQHEFAHLMGLVNVGTPDRRGHEDGKQRRHCSNKKCLMYHSMDSVDAFSSGGLTPYAAVPLLDSNCMIDLKGNGGR